MVGGSQDLLQNVIWQMDVGPDRSLPHWTAVTVNLNTIQAYCSAAGPYSYHNSDLELGIWT